MNLKYAQLLGNVPSLGGAAKRKIEMAFSMALARRLPLPECNTQGMAAACDAGGVPIPVTVDRISFERIAAQCGVIDKIAELNEQTGVDAEYIMKFTCDLWCARARVAYPLPASYITTAYSGGDLFDRVFNYSHYISKDNLDIFGESANDIVALSNGFAAMM